MHFRALLPCLILGAVVFSAEPGAPGDVPGFLPATDPAYRLSSGDRIIVSIFGEPELGSQQIVDRDGQVRLPLIGIVTIGGRTVREAETLIEGTYQSEELLRNPQATLALSNYAPREVTLLGAIRSPGTFQFPADIQSIDIRDVIARHGGFSPVAKGDAVAVTRRQPDGREVTTIINVERMMSGRARSRDSDEVFLVYPDDRIFVPERLF